MREFVCFGAHPDDIEFGCGGTVVKLLAQGYRGRFVVMTNGENGFKVGDLEAPPQERARIRKEEQLAVARRLGLAEVVFLGYRDGHLAESEELRRSLVEVLKRSRPEKVFCFDPANQEFDDLNRHHRDHRVSAIATFDACFAAKNRWLYPGEPHRVEELCFFFSHRPDHFEDISGVIDAKLELLACHRSQFPDFERVKRTVRERMCPPRGEYAHAEAFRVLRVEQRV
jgi:LmbE family N-acetylglucosaminyl deacetylase